MSSPCVDPGGRSGLSGHLIMGFFEVKKVYPNAGAAVQDVLFDGMTIVSGGFGLCGIPERLIAAIEAAGVKGLTCVSNNAGIDGEGLGKLLRTRPNWKMIASYVGENKERTEERRVGKEWGSTCKSGWSS